MTGGRADEARVRTVFLGSGGFGREGLRRLSGRDDTDLVGVVTAPARPAGRSQQLTTTPLADTAAELGRTTILTPARLRAPESIAAVLALRPDLLVLADYGQIVPAALLGVPLGALNLHPSVLPRHRGSTPIPAAIMAGEAETGVSLMRMDEGLDTGPIVDQERVALDGTETTPALEALLEHVAAGLLDRNLGRWISGELEPRPQDDAGATLTRPLRREDGRLDPRRTPIQLERQVRAYQPWPGSFVDTPVGRIVVWSAGVVDGASANGTAGVDGSARPPRGSFDELGLGVSDGERLRLLEVQPAGGKRMTWDAFVRGRPSIVGARVQPGP
ncbi:MAG: methionyl-tRNA formyltransferase [Chloroflexota bacterium]|nr:methionyl-tRNA formyltransferase [Chloroflexota bacterium]